MELLKYLTELGMHIVLFLISWGVIVIAVAILLQYIKDKVAAYKSRKAFDKQDCWYE